MIYTGKCEVRSERLEAFLLVAKELKVSSVEDWKVDKNGVVTGTIEEEVEDGECVEVASDNLSSQESYERRRIQKKTNKMAKRTTSNILTETKTFQNTRKMQRNFQTSRPIEKQEYVGRRRKDMKPYQLPLESRARDNKLLLAGRTTESAKEELQNGKNNPRDLLKKREIGLEGKGNDVVFSKPTFDCQVQPDSRSGRELKCKFCENLFVSKGALSFHMASEQCL